MRRSEFQLSVLRKNYSCECFVFMLCVSVCVVCGVWHYFGLSYTKKKENKNNPPKETELIDTPDTVDCRQRETGQIQALQKFWKCYPPLWTMVVSQLIADCRVY